MVALVEDLGRGQPQLMGGWPLLWGDLLRLRGDLLQKWREWL